MKALFVRSAVSLLVLVFVPTALAQEYLGQRTLPASDPGFHVDEFFFTAPFGIRTLNARVSIDPMNQVQPGGALSVFPTALTAEEAERDSHFLFDISSATILSQYEDSTMLRTSVEFTSDFPTSLDLARVYTPHGHLPFSASVYGEYINGAQYSQTIVFVPEPSVSALLILGAALVFIPKTRATRC